MGRLQHDEPAQDAVSWSAVAAGLTLVAVFYLSAGAVYPDLGTGPQSTLAVSLNAGVVTALVLLVPRTRVPAYLLAVAAVTVLIRVPDSREEAVVAVLVATANAAAVAIFGVTARRWAAAGRDLEHQRAVLALLGCAVIAAAANAVLVLGLSRLAAAAGLLASTAALPVEVVAGVRLAAQIGGIVTLTPLLLLLVVRTPGSWPPRAWAQVGAWTATVVALGTVAVVAAERPAVVPVALLLSFTALIWAVLRLGSLAAAVLTPAFSLTAAVMMRALATSPAAGGGSGATARVVVAAQLVGLAAAVTAWTVSSVVTQRDAVAVRRQGELARKVASGQQRFAAAMSGLLDPVAITRPVGQEGDGKAADLVVDHVNDAAAAWGTRRGDLLLQQVPESARGELVRTLLAAYEQRTPLVAEAVHLPGPAAPASAQPGASPSSDGEAERVWAEDGPHPGDRFIDMQAVRLDDELLVSWRDVTARHLSQAELSRRALYDPVTGLGNRQLLMDRLAIALRQLGRDPGTLAVLYLDLDHFKDINDSLGHDIGDVVLRAVATRMLSVLRPSDTVARLAGDEFVVLARVRNSFDAAGLAERLYAAVHRPLADQGLAITPSTSIGVTTTDAPDADADALLREADMAMYVAKHRGSRPWELFDPVLHERAEHRLSIQADLAQALDEGWFRLHYQPIIDVMTGRIVAAEALLRMNHPKRGLLGPASFIDIAEDSDLILSIGAWTLREALSQLHAWQQLDGGRGLQMSVNVSGRQVRRLDLPDLVEGAASRAGVDVADVIIEITERVLVDERPHVLQDLRRLTGLGCGLAIDDFGTGYSSLTYLKRFPVSSVKIDRSFVDGLGRDEEDTAIVAAVTGLARTLGLTAVAEGVGSAAHLEMLRSLGCHRAQGFHIGRPVPATDLTARLVQESAGSARC